jgi:hypothetical protein
MAGDFNKPISTDTYVQVLQELRDIIADVAKGLDPALALGTANILTNVIRWSSVGKKWEKFNGSTWEDLSADYAISITGSAAKWTTGRTITIGGDASGASGAWDGSANLSFNITLNTVTADKGGTGISAYSIGDLLYASGASTLSKLSGVATGNVLLSGGIGTAPSWGKVGLGTHVSGTLGLANGGTGQTTLAGVKSALGIDAAQTTANNAIAGNLEAGTRCVFNQSNAPTGWTKDTTAALNDSLMRIVTGTVGSGGSTAFSTFNGQTATALHYLTLGEIPSHSHQFSIGFRWAGTNTNYPGVWDNGGTGATQTCTPNSAGGDGGHSHGITTSIKYYDSIIAYKN